ncbi:MAG: hypothetical protein IJG67_02845 [Oscillospiraceae bacterium]|nr:hypothetical protein [Oscillospiraceae bacterium]
MEKEKEKEKTSILDRLYGGLNMSWPAVTVFAAVTAVLTAAFLIIPVFKRTSFERMGVYLEAWIFFAVIIMANCKKPLESALKTFVFFLISQPLIYLLQVPFSDLGWGIFRYYTYWFIWTLITFPMAFFGWYITKKNWISVLIFSPVLAFLGYTAWECGSFASRHFPKLIIAALFCIMQILIYAAVFFPDLRQKAVGILLPAVTAAVVAFASPGVNISTAVFLSDDPVIGPDAVITSEEDAFAQLSLSWIGDGAAVRVEAKEYGTMDFTVTDDGKQYTYTLTVFEDDEGHTRVTITDK